MAGWFGGILGQFDSEYGKRWKKLDNFYYTWREDGTNLKSFIKLDPIDLKLDDGTPLIIGTVYYELITETKRIVSEENLYKVQEKKGVINTHWNRFWLTGNSFIILDKSRGKERIFKIISQALSGSDEIITPVEFNIKAIFDDYSPNIWLGAFKDREGNIHSGTFYGENIVDDAEMGEAYESTTHKNQVGFITNYFEGVLKVKVTRSGYIAIYANLEETPDQAFQFIRDELTSYI